LSDVTIGNIGRDPHDIRSGQWFACRVRLQWCLAVAGSGTHDNDDSRNPDEVGEKKGPNNSAAGGHEHGLRVARTRRVLPPGQRQGVFQPVEHFPSLDTDPTAPGLATSVGDRVGAKGYCCVSDEIPSSNAHSATRPCSPNDSALSRRPGTFPCINPQTAGSPHLNHRRSYLLPPGGDVRSGDARDTPHHFSGVNDLRTVVWVVTPPEPASNLTLPTPAANQ